MTGMGPARRKNLRRDRSYGGGSLGRTEVIPGRSGKEETADKANCRQSR